LLGEREAVKLLSETLEEEKAADTKLTQVAKKINIEAKAA
jgi:ferritin-like metal-binding protein YciE